jgi:hypothetical protein
LAWGRDDRLEAVRAAQRQLQRHVATERRAHENRVLQFQRIAELDDELDVVFCRQLVFLLPPFGVVRRVGLAMARQVIGDDVIVPGELLVFEQAAPLMVMAAGGVLADDRLAASVVEVEDLVLVAVYLDRHVAACHWRMADHGLTP